jgi:hypothetical protein
LKFQNSLTSFCKLNWRSWNFGFKCFWVTNQAKLALNTKRVMASPFGITRHILLLLQGWFVRPMSKPLLHEEKPWLIRDSNPGPLGFKSAMLPTEPWRSSFRILLKFSIFFFKLKATPTASPLKVRKLKYRLPESFGPTWCPLYS